MQVLPTVFHLVVVRGEQGAQVGWVLFMSAESLAAAAETLLWRDADEGAGACGCRHASRRTGGWSAGWWPHAVL